MCSRTSNFSWIGLQFAEYVNVVTTCMFCDSSLSFGAKLLHERYCSAEHKEAYLHSMDRLGLERLVAAKPPIKSYEPCTKAVELEEQSQAQPAHVQAEPKTPNFAQRMRPHLELSQGEAAVAGV
jgi:hypothetical protein